MGICSIPLPVGPNIVHLELNRAMHHYRRQSSRPHEKANDLYTVMDAVASLGVGEVARYDRWFWSIELPDNVELLDLLCVSEVLD
jgi:hypothetical protein